MPTRNQELLKFLKIMQAVMSGLFYRLYASLHSSSPSDRGEHTQELVRLTDQIKQMLVPIAWPGFADADATMISPAMEKLRPIGSNEWRLLDDLVEDPATLVDDSGFLAKLTHYLQELNKLGPANICKLTKLYCRYDFLPYVFFTYTLSEVFVAMQQSGQCLRDFISREDGLPHDYWRNQLCPALLNLSHDTSLLGMLTIENAAIVEFLESRYKLGGNMEEALNILWDLGVRAGGKPIRWTEVVAQLRETQVNEGLQDSFYRLITVLKDYIEKKKFAAILAEGAEGKLLNSLKKATWHDFLDEKKRARAKKRKAKVVFFSQLSGYQGNGDKALPFDEVAGEADDAYERTEVRLTLEELAQRPELAHREKEAFLLRMKSARDGEEPTFEEIGKLMGVTKGTVKNLLDSAYEKLGRYAPRV